ncbi:hypothetical protein C1H46_045621 [Malus baccata]|uniref:Uncharacterized protein n=1 Tax=Malus baccata TaxID=106549 RepID=A0A540K3P9_MALBA|nr:hypothetical protein C1H46_045621 [Malus baccata]
MKGWKSSIQREVKKMQRRKLKEEDGSRRYYDFFCFYFLSFKGCIALRYHFLDDKWVVRS